MGIPKLLDLLESIKVPVELSDFSGKKIAVDGHCWIYNAMGMYKFRVKRGTTNTLWLNYLLNRLDELKENNITPIIVFDGQKVPIKQPCYSKREQKYSKPTENEYTTPSAWDSYELVKQSVQLLKKRKVQYIIAPFEADPQLTHLSITDQVDAVLSIDSDLLIFGCKQVIFRRRQIGGTGYYRIRQEDIFKINEHVPHAIPINLTGFNQTRFRHLCILAGCDYSQGFKQLGLKRILKLMYQCNDTSQIITQLLLREQEKNDSEYRKEFENANAGFLYQFVFDPKTQLYMRLHPLPPGELMFDMELLGESPRITDIPMHKFNDANDVETVDLDGLEDLFESLLHIESTVSLPILKASTLIEVVVEEEEKQGDCILEKKDYIEVEEKVIDEIVFHAVAAAAAAAAI